MKPALLYVVVEFCDTGELYAVHGPYYEDQASAKLEDIRDEEGEAFEHPAVISLLSK